MVNKVPRLHTPARTRNVSLKQLGPKQEVFEWWRKPGCCSAASLSYKYPARRPENKNAPRGFPSSITLKKVPKCFSPKSSDTVGIMMEVWTP
ncbi:hypothetical protein BHE74_00024474 [Ensete ventricosum]|nr:hypothetical protein BHE74_00024474 [Ensete ventricosum]